MNAAKKDYGCHTEKSTTWAAEKVTKWHGPNREDHFSDHLLAGVCGEKSELYFLLAHHDFPEIARASATSVLANFLTDEDARKIKSYLKDTSALVRNEAVKLIGAIHPQDEHAFLQ